MLKKGFSVLTFLLGWHLLLGSTIPVDTLVTLEEVSVISPRSSGFNEALSVTCLDSACRREELALPLGQLLMYYLPVSLNQYGGRGALTTLSLRGNSADHTEVLWNGFPLNSLTTGVADLSGIRADLFSRVTLVSGIPDSRFADGTGGGALELTNEPGRGDGFKAKAGISQGSFHNFSGNVGIETGNTHFHYSGQLFLEDALNDFLYHDVLKPEEPLTLNEHNHYAQAGTYHTFSYQSESGHSIQAGLWAQRSSYQVPQILGSYLPSYQQQQDSILRLFAGWEKRSVRTVTGIRVAWFYEGLRFTDKNGPEPAMLTIDSHIQASRMMTDAYLQWVPALHWNIEIGGSLTAASALADAYVRPVRELRGTIMAGLKYHNRKRMLLTLHASGTFVNDLLSPQVSMGIRYALVQEKVYLRSRIYSHHKLPSFNDKYWTPGGNPDLHEERGWGTTTGIEGDWDLAYQGNLTFSADVYYNKLNNQIMWIPATGYWTPVNLQRSTMYGLEQSVRVTLQAGKLSYFFGERYHFTRSLIDKNSLFPQFTGKNNPYIPQHTLTANTGVHAGRFYGTFFETFSSTRYTTADNQQWYSLKPYALSTLTAGYKTCFHDWGISVQGVVQNLFNTPYQSVSAWPLPGRSFLLQLKITYLNRSIKQKAL